MTASKTICLTCRHRLATKAIKRTSQWYSKGTYSTGVSTASNDAPIVKNEPQSQSSGHRGGNKAPVQANIRRILARDEQRPVMAADQFLSSPRPSRQRNIESKSGAEMDLLFQQIVARNKGGSITESEATQKRNWNMALVQGIGKLQQMLDMDAPIATTYTFLRTELYPIVREEGVSIPKVFFTVVSSVMQKLISVKMHNMWASDLPPVAEIFRGCADIGEMRPGQWMLLVGKLVTHLCEMSGSPADYPSIEAFEKHVAARDEIVADLLECWKVLSLPKDMGMKPSGDEDDIIDGFWFPRLDKFATKKFHRSGNFTLAFNSLFPQYPANLLGEKHAVLAIATFILIMDRTRSSAIARRTMSRFMSKVAHLLTFVGINDKTLRRAVASTFSDMESYIMNQWPTTKEHLRHIDEMSDHSADTVRWQKPEQFKGVSEQDVFDASHIGRRLAQAYGTRNANEVDRLWETFALVPRGTVEERAAELQKHPHLFDSFINTYMALNQPDKAIEVWNTLPKVDLLPTIKTWNVMLDGCKKARNASGLKMIWARLVDSGVGLDVPIWTTRIAGLMDCNDPEAGLGALEEMAALWRGAKQDGKKHAVQPAIQPVNAALQGLIRLNKTSGAQKLLAWAKAQGIRPDIITFNLLLRPAVREGRDKEIQAIFKSMKTLNINADAATFTIILDGILTKHNARDPDKQVEIVETTFNEMQAVGLEAGVQTHGKMIYLLLRSGDRAQESVKAVLDHLWDHGHELSPHIYTMLVEHYFSRRPPDLATVDSLLRRRRLLDYDDMDRVFYNRVIKGYALAGAIDAALKIHWKLSAAGFFVDLSTQYEVLRALVLSGRAEEARTLVQDTIAKYSDRNGEEGWRGHAFWHMAARNGIIEWAQDTTGGRAIMR
ncbi:hypothetical protein BJ170DRAFT_621322 [Xylariales sp. AK1849]|nr:hypothetical protein BJ170DRAFT_621322 [Xylariales sp. AK1849]